MLWKKIQQGKRALRWGCGNFKEDNQNSFIEKTTFERRLEREKKVRSVAI